MDVYFLRTLNDNKKIKRRFLFFLGLIIIIGFYNCKTNSDSKDNKTSNLNSLTDVKSTIDTNRLIDRNKEIVFMDTLVLKDFIDKLEVRKLPFYDSTNFENSDDYQPLKSDWIRFLKLEQIYPYDLKTVDKIWIRDRLDISDNFISLVIGFNPNENELFTTLIIFSKDFDLIDFEPISYDEIAESCMRTESYLDKNKITKFDTDFCYKQTTDTIEYKIKNNGEIIASR